MTRRTIFILAVISLASLVLGVLVPGISLALTSNIPAAILTAGAIALVLGCLAGATAWVTGLIHTAAVGQWGWFVAILIFNVPGSLAYGLRAEIAIPTRPL